MTTAQRTVRHLRLTAPSRAEALAMLPRLEDALRCASLPDDGARLLVVRRLALGRLRHDIAAGAVASTQPPSAAATRCSISRASAVASMPGRSRPNASRRSTSSRAPSSGRLAQRSASSSRGSIDKTWARLGALSRSWRTVRCGVAIPCPWQAPICCCVSA